MHHALIFNVNNGQGTRRIAGGHKIASFLRSEGWDVEVIDWTYYWSLEELQELCKSRINSKTVFCGFSCFFTYWDSKNENFAKWLKTTFPDVKLLIGSQGSPVNIKSSYIEYYIQGYGEKAILELCKYFAGNITQDSIKFDLRFTDKKVINAIHSYPAYPSKSLMTKYEDRDYIHHTEWLTMEFSRGCIFKCSFCNFPILGVKSDHTRDVEDFRAQITDTYDRFGVTNYNVADETFNDYTEKIIKYADVIDTLPFDPWFSGFIRADLLVSRPQDWEHLLRLGFLGHFYGIETTNPKSSKAIGKGMNPLKLCNGILEAKKYFQNNGRKLYRGTMSFIAGLPYETEETLNDTKKWIEQNWEDQDSYIAPLQILIDDKEVQSDISLDYKKYGYRPNLDYPVIDYLGQPSLNWVNDYLSYEFCKDYCQNTGAEMFQKYGSKVGVHWIGDYMQNGESIEDVLALRFHSYEDAFSFIKPSKTFLERFETYKTKKLSN